MSRWQRDPSIGTTMQGYAHVLLKFGELHVYLDRFFREEARFAAASLSLDPSASPRQDSTAADMKRNDAAPR